MHGCTLRFLVFRDNHTSVPNHSHKVKNMGKYGFILVHTVYRVPIGLALCMCIKQKHFTDSYAQSQNRSLPQALAGQLVIIVINSSVGSSTYCAAATIQKPFCISKTYRVCRQHNDQRKGLLPVEFAVLFTKTFSCNAETLISH